jgi:hypothetical protein
MFDQARIFHEQVRSHDHAVNIDCKYGPGYCDSNKSEATVRWNVRLHLDENSEPIPE